MDTTQPRYSLCKNIAVDLLLNQPSSSFIVDARNLVCDKHNIIFVSFREYCETTGQTVGDITCSCELLDGYTVKYKDTYIVLFDETSVAQRLRFSLAHELGHILLNHSDDTDIKEKEANCFASHLLIPDCILSTLIHNIYAYDLDCTRSTFGVSWDTAAYKVQGFYNKIKSYGHLNTSSERMLLLKYDRELIKAPKSYYDSIAINI